MPTLSPKGFTLPVGSDNNENVDFITGIVNRMEEVLGGLTSAQISALSGNDLWMGRQVFNTTTREYMWYNGNSWEVNGFVRGEIREYPMTGPPPPGWLWAEGGVVNIADHPFLFDRYGTTFGGNGTTTFGLPNRQGRVGVGRDTGVTEFNVIGKTGGSRNKILETSEMPPHQHTANHDHTGSTAGAGGHDHTGSTNNAGSHQHSVPNTHTGGVHNHGFTTAQGGFSYGILAAGLAFSSLGGVPRMDLAPGSSGWWIYGGVSMNNAGGHVHSVPNTNSNGTHNHGLSTNSVSNHSHNVTINNRNVTTNSVGGGQAFSLLQPYFTTRYIVKA